MPKYFYYGASPMDGLNRAQDAVHYLLFRVDHPLSLSDIVRTYREDYRNAPLQTDSGIRTRVKELKDLGYVAVSGTRTNERGRQERLFETA